MKPISADPKTTFAQLLEGLEVLQDEAHIKNAIGQIIAKLQRAKRRLNADAAGKFKDYSGGLNVDEFIKKIESKPLTEAKQILLNEAGLLELLDGGQRGSRYPKVVSDKQDILMAHERGFGKYDQRPGDYLESFGQFVKNNINEIAALNIICTRPKELTRETLKSLRMALAQQGFTTKQLNTALSEMTSEEITADIISLVRRYAIGSPLVSHQARIRNAVNKLKKTHNFSKIELNWLENIETYLLNETVMNETVFDEDPRFKGKGGFKKINQFFKGNLKEIMSELNCDVLRDDGITYHQYVTELTYILFLKMAKETEVEKNFGEGVTLTPGDNLTEEQIAQNAQKQIILNYSWDVLKSKTGIELYNYYKDLLRLFGTYCTGNIRAIYDGAVTNIEEPKNLEKIIKTIDKLDWYSAREEGLGNLYEGLLEKNANEKKSGAGQYFTPRVLIDVMTRLVKPQPKERCNDPACGTFGFMIAAHRYVKEHTDDFYDLDEETSKFERNEAFTGCELVRDTRRLALMNAMLHDIEGEIKFGDTLSNIGKSMKGYDVVLTNPPFGTKKGGERATRDDFTFPTSNKQLNFLQHIYRSLKADGKARAAVVLPDNVLFADGDGEKIRCDLMDKCNLHTVLRLPTGIFYAQGVKTNVLFFTRGTSDKGNTKEVWFYDLRTNMPSFGKTTPLKAEHFAGFEKACEAQDRRAVQDERWNVFTRDEIAAKGNSLDLGLIRDDSVLDYNDLPDPAASAAEAAAQLEEAVDLLQSVVKELNALAEVR